MATTDLPQRYAVNQRLLGAEGFKKIREAKLLVVGAGGIGCELLKTLVLSGFENIEVIDLDTIDASNLNRQFLFTKEDVGGSKAKSAAKTAGPFNPLSKITSYHGNIKEQQFGTSFFEKFDLVINALDNLDARKHVNRMCVKLGKPMIESGTRGYVGQVQPIQKGMYECFDCRPRHEARQYAYCTIRSNPTRVVHCVAFAKVLYEHLFGNPEDDDDPVEFKNIKKESEEAGESTPQLAVRLFNVMHNKTVQALLDMPDRTWTTAKPIPLQPYEAPKVPPKPKASTAVLSVEEQAYNFVTSVTKLLTRDRSGFDKDDDLAMEFVCACTNLRAAVYSIKMDSFFEVKAIAGNIVPAIATTNAIISGTVVLEAIKILKGRLQDCRFTFCGPVPKSFKRKPCILYPSELVPPAPKCYICSGGKQQVVLKCDTNTTTLGYFVKNILQAQLSLAEPCIDTDDGGVYEHDRHQGHAKLSKSLADNELGEGVVCIVMDCLQDVELEITIQHKDCGDAGEFEIIGDISSAPPPTPEVAAPNANHTQEDDDDDEVIDYVPVNLRREEGKKRSLEEAPEGEPSEKRQRTEVEDVISLDD